MTDVPNRAHDDNRKADTSSDYVSTQEKLEGLFSSVDVSLIKDPMTGTVHADLSDPNHPFWKGKSYD